MPAARRRRTAGRLPPRRPVAAASHSYFSCAVFLVVAHQKAPLVYASCDESAYYSDADCDDTLANNASASEFGLYGTLIVYSLLTSLVAWIGLLYPFYFTPKFQSKVRGYVELGHRKRGTIVSMRRGRVFNPLRFCLPSRHNCYVTVAFGGQQPQNAQSASTDNAPNAADASPSASAVSSSAPPNEDTPPTAPGPSTTPQPPAPYTVGSIRKELVIEEEALQLLIDRSSHSIDVYTAGPSYPASGMLNDQYQGTRIALPAKIAYALGSLALLSIALYLSFIATADRLYASPHMWKFYLVLLGHVVVLGLAYWSCHLDYRGRVEALLSGTIDDGTAAYGRCGIASMEKGEMGGGGMVEMAESSVGSASMNSLEGGSGGGSGKVAEEEAEDGAQQQPYHAMT